MRCNNIFIRKRILLKLKLRSVYQLQSRLSTEDQNQRSEEEQSETVISDNFQFSRFRSSNMQSQRTFSANKTNPIRPVQPGQQMRSEPQSTSSTQLVSKLIENIQENFAGYLFFGAIVFIIIACLAWILVFFPKSTNVTIGKQTWIAGDTVVIFGVFVILFSEFIIGKSKYSDLIPINYLGIGIGLGIGILGILSIRFEIMPVFLPESGLVNKNWLFFMLSILIALLSWIYAWRSPYRDLIFGSLVTGFILIDYSLQLQMSVLVAIGILSGLALIFLPGIHASLVETQDNRFFFGALIVYDALVLKVDNVLALINLDPILYSITLFLPIALFIALMSLKKINMLYMFLCLPTSSFMLVINEITFMNDYISSGIFSIVFIGIVFLFGIPKLLFRDNSRYTILITGLNAVLITIHVFLSSLDLIPSNIWFVVFVPVIFNIIIFFYEVRFGSIKIEYLVVLYAFSIVSLGLHLDTLGLLPFLLGISLIFTFLLFGQDNSLAIKNSFLATTLLIGILGSNFTILKQWEIVSIPFIIPLLVVFYLVR